MTIMSLYFEHNDLSNLNLFNPALCHLELVKLLPVHRYRVDIFHILVLQEYWLLTESKIQLKSVLVGVRILTPSISSQEQTQ